MTDQEIQDNFGCRYCGAKPGEPCTDIWKKPQEMHGVRISIAKKISSTEFNNEK